MKISRFTALVASAISAVLAADTSSWQSRNIYFVLTDRIARSENDGGGGSCGNLGNYCGGTFKVHMLITAVFLPYLTRQI